MTGGYRTQQKTELLAYLKSMQGKHTTVNQIVDHFAETGVQIGVTTIYRQLNKLVAEGSVKKIYVDDTTGSCFEYVARDSDHSDSDHFHLKCEKCDRLIHFDCKEVIELQLHVQEKHGFTIDPVRTVFYGICKNCSEIDKANKE